MPATRDELYAIILAAGASSRLGSPKQLLQWQGRTLLERVIDETLNLLPSRVIAVLGAHAEQIQSAISLINVTTKNNPNWPEGMASSLHTGILALPPTAQAALILLSDQPLINRYHINDLVEKWQHAPDCIVACEYKQTVGVPAIFPANRFNDLLNLQGDSGAKAVLMKFREQILTLPLPEAEFDIDCAADTAVLKRNFKSD